jgi:phosphoribosylformylglycinamidine cyclo-ligase
MGIGMVAVVAREAADVALATLADRGLNAWVAGSVVERGDLGEAVTLTDNYAV